MKPIADIEGEIAALDAKIRPIAKTPLIDSRNPRTSMGAPAPREPFGSPLDRARVADVAGQVIDDIVTAYAAGSDSDRSALRTLLRTYSSFRWAAGWSRRLALEPPTAARLRQALIFFSAKDQGRDSRDAIVWLDRFCALARDAGLPLAGLLVEVAALSSDESPFKSVDARLAPRSTRRLLLDYSERFAAGASGT